jgi:N-acetyl sugar amidotransferase
MDTTDPDISFDAEGKCCYCHEYENYKSKLWLRGKEGEQALENSIAEIKAYGKGKEYDCIIGLSGGVDSSYLAYLGNIHGLRMLAVHVDAGWNSELAVKNIENICKKLNIDLVTEVVDWDTMKEVQRAFFKARLVNQDIPQDSAFFAALYKYARKNNIKYVLTGSNITTESTLPVAWQGFSAADKKHIKAVHKKNGEKSISKFPMINFWVNNYYYQYIVKLKKVNLLNYIDYDSRKAKEILKEKLDYKEYGSKHHESIFTRFHQCYFLPTKFGFEKRKCHLASMVMSGLMSREEAMEELKTPLYPNEQMVNEDKEFVARKLGFTNDEFNTIMAMPPGRHEDYPASQTTYKKIAVYINWFGFLKKLFK